MAHRIDALIQGLTPAEQALLADLERGDVSLSAPDVQQLLTRHPTLGRYVATLETAAAVVFDRQSESPDVLFARLATRIRSNPPSTLALGPGPSPRAMGWMPAMPPRRWMLWGGASVVVAFLAFWAGRLVSHADNARTSARVATYTTGNGQRATITLADGSVVWLNVASRLDVPGDYTRGNRALRLTGEALFQVAHRDGTPLTVAAGGQVTQVLGTRFVVRHYADEARTVVAVQDGKVAVRATGALQSVSILSARQQALVRDNGSATIESADPTQFSFTTGVLSFNDVPIREAMPSLERWYDVHLVLADRSLDRLRIVGGFRSGSVTDLMGVLELLFDVRVVRDGNTVTLYPK